MRLDPFAFVIYRQLSLLYFRWSVVSQNQSMLQFDCIATHFSTFPPAVRNWTASLPHLCRMFAAYFGCILAVRIFAASFASGVFCTARVPSFTALVALGRTWLLATSGFTELHKAPHFQKCRSSNTSITIFQTCFNFKNKFYQKLLLFQNAGPHKCPTQSSVLHCDSGLGLVTSTEPGVGAWRWCLCLGSGWSLVWRLGCGPGLGLAGHFGACAGLLQRGLLATGFPNPSCREDSFLRSAEGSPTPEMFNPAARE